MEHFAVGRQPGINAALGRSGGNPMVLPLEVLDAITDAFWVFDKEWRVAYLNAAAERMIGRSRSEVINQVLWSAFPDIVGGAIEQLYRRVSNTGIAESMDQRWRNGWFELRVFPGNSGGLNVYILDVTERRRARDEAARMQHEAERRLAELELIYETAPVGLLFVDRDLRYVRINERMAQMNGLLAKDHLGRTIFELLPNIASTVAPDYRHVIETGCPIIEKEIKGSTPAEPGVEHTYLVSYYPVKDHLGVVMGVTAVVHDFSAQKQAEEALRASEQRFALFMRHLPGAAWLKDLSGRYVFANETAQEIFHTGLAELVGRTDDEIFPVLTAGQFKANDRIAVETGTPVQVIEVLRQEDGDHQSLVAKFPIPGKNGGPILVGGIAIDITEHKKTENALRESETRFRTLSSHAPVGIFLADINGRCLLVNERWSEFSGLSSMEAAGQPWFGAVHPDDRERVCHAWRRAALTGTEFSSEYRFLTPQGKVTWLQGSAVALHDTHGGLEGYIGTTTDITAQRTAREELRATQQQLDRILSSITEAFFALDREWRFTFANHRVVHRLGIPLEQILGRTFWDLVPEAQDTEFRPQYLRVMDERVTVHFEVFHPPSRDWLEVYAHPTEEGLTSLILNITARKQTEEAVERSEKRFRALLENSSDGIVVIGRDAKVSYSAVPVLGRSMEELKGTNGIELIHPECRDMALRQLSLLIRTPGAVVKGEYRVRHRDGSWRWIEAVAKNLLDDLYVLGIVVNYRDVTGRKELEEQFRQAQKLESLGVLAGGIAHDFNNLLVGMLGNATLAMDVIPESHAARPMIEGIATAGERAANLIRQMLAYSGRGKFLVEPVGLSDLVREMLGLLHSSIPRNVILRQDLPQQLPNIEADSSQVQQLVMNFVINAAEAIGDKPGIVTVRTGMRSADAHYIRTLAAGHDIEPGNYVYFEVSDTGIGMDESTRRKIFDPFFTTKNTGRGLGLAAALGIVRGHKGGISVESIPGNGTIFRVLFPASSALAQLRPERKPETDLDGAGTILLVDDEHLVRRMAGMTLERRGYRVLLASNGKEGLSVFEAEPGISLVVLDLSMPEMGGAECLAKMKALRPEIPIILSSGYNESDAVGSFTGQDLAGFVQKPYTVADLARKIKAVLRRDSQ